MSMPCRPRTTTFPAGLSIAIGRASLAALLLAVGSPVRADDEKPRATARYYPRCGLTGFEAGAGPPLVLLHGYGSAPEEWFQFITTIHPPDKGGFVFPTGPEATAPPHGPAGKRAWWQLRLDTYVPPGATLPDMSKTRPPGLPRASAKIRALLDELEREQGRPPGAVVLGGFSQGAMVAANVAFTSNAPMRALILLSPTPVDERRWRRGLAHRRNLPVFIAHGRKDEVLSYAGSEHLQQLLSQAGLAVTFVPFEGGHEIPMPVVDKLNEFLAKLPPVAHTAARENAQAPGRGAPPQEKLGH